MSGTDLAGIQITHFSEQEFLEVFRKDLANAWEKVIILSPFLSRNRAIYYYPVLGALVARQVPVQVFARPRSEQPETLRDHFEEIERTLSRLGVRLLLRVGMHEKIAAIDGKILWHGSLNILSHSNTLESMLRFESSKLVEEILTDLQLDGLTPTEGATASRSELPGVTSERGAPLCPECGGSMRLYSNSGMWICSASPACAGTRLLTDNLDVVAEPSRQVLELGCPICQEPLEVRRGINVRIACSSLSCPFALDPRVSTGLLRVLKRIGAL